jgi:hypothetical protein
MKIIIISNNKVNLIIRKSIIINIVIIIYLILGLRKESILAKDKCFNS